MTGEQLGGDETALQDPRSLLAKPRWQRLLIAFAGPFMNVLLAVAILTGMYMVSYPRLSPADMDPVIGAVLAGSPAEKAGVKPGDRIVTIDGKENPRWEDVALKEPTGAYRPISITLERNGERIDTTVTPILDERTGVGSAGWAKRGQVILASVDPSMPAHKAGLKPGDIILSLNGQPIDSTLEVQEITKASGGKPVHIEYERDGVKRAVSVEPAVEKKDGPARWMIGVAPGLKSHFVDTQLPLAAALRESISENARSAMMITQFLKGIVERRMSAKNLTGPVGLIQISGDAAREGATVFLGLMAMVSLNLAVFNLLPIPILDGGVIVMLLVEMAMKRDLSMKVKEAVFKVGFVFIMLIVAFVLYSDISRYLPNG
jgi:regulator of sigma E protease